MKKLDVFLIQDKSKGKDYFEQSRAKIEINSFIRVANKSDWRCSLNSAQGCSDVLDTETLMVDGEWIDDSDCRAVISIFNRQNKPIFQQDAELRRYLDAYIKTIKLQCLLAEYFRYYPLTKSVESYIIGRPLTIAHIRSKSRDRELVNARAIFCKACRDILYMTLQEIAWLINRDYTSVIYLLQKYDDWYSTSSECEFQRTSSQILDRLRLLQ